MKKETTAARKLKTGRFPEYLTDIYITLMLTLFLLCFCADGYSAITELKFRVFLWLTGGYLIVLVVGIAELLLVRCITLPPRKKFWKCLSWTQRFILCFLFFTFLSWICSPWRAQSFFGMTRSEGFLTITLYCALFFAVSLFTKPKKWMLYVFGASMTLFCLISFLQLGGFNPLGLYPDGINYYGSGVAYSGMYLGTIGNADLVAALLCLAIPVFLFAVIKLSGRLRWFLLLPLAACLVLAAWMQVSAAVLGLGGGLLMTIPFAVRRGHRKRAVITVATVILAGLLAVFLLPNLPSMLGEAHELLHGRVQDSFGSGRIFIWRHVLEAILERPLLGWGPDTLSERIAAVFERYDAAQNVIYQAGIDVAHNEYLNIFACQGLFALLSYLAALAAALAAWSKNKQSKTAILCGSAVLCYCIQAFFGISMCMTAPFFWIALGILDASTRKG